MSKEERLAHVLMEGVRLMQHELLDAPVFVCPICGETRIVDDPKPIDWEWEVGMSVHCWKCCKWFVVLSVETKVTI